MNLVWYDSVCLSILVNAHCIDVHWPHLILCTLTAHCSLQQKAAAKRTYNMRSKIRFPGNSGRPSPVKVTNLFTCELSSSLSRSQSLIVYVTSLWTVIKLLSKRCRIPNLLVKVGLSHERPSKACAHQSPPPNSLIMFNMKFYTSIQKQNNK